MEEEERLEREAAAAGRGGGGGGGGMGGYVPGRAERAQRRGGRQRRRQPRVRGQDAGRGAARDGGPLFGPGAHGGDAEAQSHAGLPKVNSPACAPRRPRPRTHFRSPRLASTHCAQPTPFWQGCCLRTRRVRLVREEGRDVSSQYGRERDGLLLTQFELI